MKTVNNTIHSEKSRKTLAHRHILGTMTCLFMTLILGNLVEVCAAEDTRADVNISTMMVANIIGKSLNGPSNITYDAKTIDVLFMALCGIAFLILTKKKVTYKTYDLPRINRQGQRLIQDEAGFTSE